MRTESTEAFAEKHADQWRGCVECKESHHATAFCRKCGKCFFSDKAKYVHDDVIGTIVTCQCGTKDLWD